jgi:hypothetical protein
MTQSLKKPVVWLTLICFIFVYAGPVSAVQTLPVPPNAPLVPQEAWDGMATLNEALRQKLDKSQFSIKALAKRLGHDPVRIFNFVRDKVAFEAYRLAIRGARGTLEGLAGNSLDQSLLLAELLAASRVQEIKIVSGELSDLQARQLIDQLFAQKYSFNVPAVKDKQSIAVTSPANGFDFNMTQPGQYEFEIEVINARGQIIHRDVALAVLDH